MSSCLKKSTSNFNYNGTIFLVGQMDPKTQLEMKRLKCSRKRHLPIFPVFTSAKRQPPKKDINLKNQPWPDSKADKKIH